jgi:hypothetical protein
MGKLYKIFVGNFNGIDNYGDMCRRGWKDNIRTDVRQMSLEG